MNDEEHKIPDWFQDIEGYVRQYCELKRLSSQLAEVLRVPFIQKRLQPGWVCAYL